MRSSVRTPRHSRHPALLALVAVALCLAATVTGAARSSAQATQPSADTPSTTALWPTFSTPSTVLVANASGLSNDDRLTATTLQGLYNGSQQPSRLYLDSGSEDDFWLAQLPKNVHTESVTPAPSQTLVQTLLERFRSVIRGAIVTNPSNTDTVNLATTMAGIDHAVVIDPSQQAMVRALGIKVLYSFDTPDFTADSVVATYQWAVRNLLPLASTRTLVALSGTNPGDIRDYAVATRSFVFHLTSDDATQKALMATILAHTPANTPVLGYVPDENPDVAYLSSLGHFLNGSDTVDNATVWASMPGLGPLKQGTEPAPIAAQPNTVYVSFLVSDGDNIDYMQGTMAQLWQRSDLGVIPEGWTVAPAAADMTPTMTRYFYEHLPRNSELVAGPSGIGYATQFSGAELTQFARLSGQIMRQQDLHTVDSFEAQGNLGQFAKDSGIPSISTEYPFVGQQLGATTGIGQASGYVKAPQDLFDSLSQQIATKKPGQPLFIEPLVDAWTMTPTDVLHVAQQLVLAGRKSGINYVFTTPTELAQTMRRYDAGTEAGLPASNVQSMTGDQVLAEPIVSPPYSSTPTTVTGPNLVTNPSGASGTTGWTTATMPWATDAGSVSAVTYQGQPALNWTVDNLSTPSWLHYYPAVTNGQTYTFSVDVAGSGQVYMDVYANSDWQTLPVRLTSSYQRLTWTVTIPSNAPGGQTGAAPQLQVRSSGAGPVSVDLKDASVAAATPAS